MTRRFLHLYSHSCEVGIVRDLTLIATDVILQLNGKIKMVTAKVGVFENNGEAL